MARAYDKKNAPHRHLLVHDNGGLARGDDVKAVQRIGNHWLNHGWGWTGLKKLAVDGEYGRDTDHTLRTLLYYMGFNLGKKGLTESSQDALLHPHKHRGALVKRRSAKRKKKHNGPLRVRALKVAEGLVGVMEHGGNNVGTEVVKIITANGGTPGEPWCGDFDAYCYRLAGSKAVTRSWASVALLGRVVGVKKVSSPEPGDIVRFNFDHTGLFYRWINRAAGEFETIEGNTGATGAVSDSTTGGDGVYRKTRYTSQVTDFRRVTR